MRTEIFGGTLTDGVRDWLARHVRAHLGVRIEEILFRSGDVGAVFGLRLDDGRDVVLKAIRDANPARLRTVVQVQRHLALNGFGCADVLDGPSSTDGVTAIVEERLTETSNGSPHDDATRLAMAEVLATQIELTRGLDGSALVAGRPAWANWDAGAWPRPHVPIFDFTKPAEGFAWVDRTADAAAEVLRTANQPAVIGHSDWVWQNVCVRDAAFVAGYDWDSLIFAPESVVVGLVAGAFTQGSPVPPDAPSAREVEAFVDDYQHASSRPFAGDELHLASAAATWVRCYNARCQLDNLQRRGLRPPAGSFFEQI